MNPHTAPRSPIRPSIVRNELRPDLFLAGVQIMITLLGAVLLTTGLLA